MHFCRQTIYSYEGDKKYQAFFSRAGCKFYENTFNSKIIFLGRKQVKSSQHRRDEDNYVIYATAFETTDAIEGSQRDL